MKNASFLVSGHRALLLSIAVVAAACSNDSSQANPDAQVSTGGTLPSGLDGGADGPTGQAGAKAGNTGDVGTAGGTGTSAGTGGAAGTVATGGKADSGGGARTGGTTGTGGRKNTGGATAGETAGGSTGQDAGADAQTGVDGAPVKSATIQLVGNKIIDINGNPFVARGPEDVMAGTGQTKDIQQAAALGANAMRMLFTLDAANGMTPTGFDTLLAEAVKQHMLVWVSLYTWDGDNNNAIGNSLGGGNFYSLTAPAGTACSKATPESCHLAVWSRAWLKDLMNKYRSNVIIDAMQEFAGPEDAGSENARVVWATAAKTNVQFFRAQGYTNPLEVMASFQGRDLYGIVEFGETIRAVDTVKVGSDPQTMFGWQAYWGTSDGWYSTFQGPLLLGKKDGLVTGPQAIHQFAATRTFPIQIGIDNFAGDTNLDYKDEIDQAAADGMSWLWWSWKNGSVECPVSGSTCQSYVTTSPNGFKGAKPLSN
jgi:hypothetical protein